MAEYLVQDTSLTSIADAIRDIDGSTDKVTPSGMVTALEGVNTEVVTQADLISQIATVLEGKSAGGASFETCSVDITVSAGTINDVTYTTIEADEVVAKREKVGAASKTITCICGSFVVVNFSEVFMTNDLSGATELRGSATNAYMGVNYVRPYLITANSGSTASIHIMMD